MPVTSSIDYYDDHASQYIKETLAVNMQTIYQPFLGALPTNAWILDAGCGSGRDSLAFKQRGYQVTAFDACGALAAHASELLEMPVAVQRFDQLDDRARYDGVWACASLLHVTAAELPETFRRLWGALLPGGVLYCSFKYGQGGRWQSGRLFTDADASRIDLWTADLTGCRDRKLWMTNDQLPGRDEQWLNVLLFKATV
jgi:SAM-dependent methyltransferase